MIHFGSAICTNLEAALSREWLETNGLGGFASSTISGAHTRRYHGLLIATTAPPVHRNLLLSKIEETVLTGEGRQELGCNLFDTVVHPEGYRLLDEFRLDPWPTWVWNAGGVRVEKLVCLLVGENIVVLEYRASAAIELELRPLLAFRDYHSTAHANDVWSSAVTEQNGVARVQPYGQLPALYFQYGSAALERTGEWYYRFQYPREKERGLDYQEDLFQPFVLRVALQADVPFHFVVSTEFPAVADAAQALQTERARRLSSSEEILPALERAADQFLMARGGQKSVIAGYHWFTDWGRDTMIAIPGLAPKDIPEVVLAFLPYLYQGLLPNRFPDAGAAPEYNSTDATLWFVEALRGYAAATGGFDFVQQHCWAALKEIVEWRERGTLYGIRVDADGLLAGGEPGAQLTWMDAKVGDRVITERAGKPVEIQALWYNALRAIAEFAERFGDAPFAEHCGALAARARASFTAQFWNAPEGCLFDVVNGGDHDGAIRPNQIFALSLPHSILSPERGSSVLSTVERELLTPFGLRTLSPRDSHYCGHYGGDQESRDGAYHQGTVWPWLLGPYVRALFAVRGKNAPTLQAARGILEPFRAHLLEAGIGQISEIFDGDAPHAPRGCIAQAWSVGELIRIAREAGV